MQFTIPTNKEQMYSVLQQIFYFYRIRREAFTELDLIPLSIPKMIYTPLEQSALLEMASKMVTPQIEREKYKEINQLEREISNLTAKKQTLEEQKSVAMQQVTTNFDKTIEKLKAEANKRGMLSSTVIVKELNQTESQRAQTLASVASEYDVKILLVQNEITTLESEIEKAQVFYAELLTKEKNAKKEELALEQDKIKREVERYNNGLDEKEQNSKNAIIRQQADLELKFRELNAEFFSKDQLIEMGYYDDVIKCVCGYYDTLPAMQAYQDFTGESKLSIYLDEYYTNILYLYRARAGQ